MLSAVQSRMARSGLNIGIREVAAAAKVSTQTIARLERGEEVRARTAEDIRRAYEEFGTEFIDDNGVRIESTNSPRRPEGSHHSI